MEESKKTGGPKQPRRNSKDENNPKRQKQNKLNKSQQHLKENSRIDDVSAGSEQYYEISKQLKNHRVHSSQQNQIN